MAESAPQEVLQKDIRVLISNFSYLSLLQIANLLLPLISMPYLITVLGTDIFGLIMFFQAFILYFNILIDFGFDLSATREISVNRECKETVEEILSSVLLIKGVLVVLSTLILSLLAFSVDKLNQSWDLLFLTFGMSIGQAIFPVWFFQGLEKMKYITILNVATKIIFLTAIIGFVGDERDYLLVPFFNSLGYIIAGLASLYLIRKKFKYDFKVPNRENILFHFRESTQFFLSRVSVSIYTTTNIVLLGFLTSNTAVGYYSIAEKLYSAIQSLYHPLVNALYPHISKARNAYLFSRIFWFVIFINSILAAALYFLSEYLIELVFGMAGIATVDIFKIFVISSVLHVPAILIGYPYLGAMGFSGLANRSVILASLLHLLGLCGLWVSGTVSVYSVSVMVLFTEAFLFLLRIYYVRTNNLVFW